MAEYRKTYISIYKHQKIRDSLCAVCSAEACGMNFNAFTCTSCRVFFRRNGCKSVESLRCLKDGTCVIDMYGRRACTFCRLQKCFAAGMSCKMIQKLEDRYPTKRRHFMKVPSEKATKIVKSKSNPCQTLITEVDHLLINQICDAYKKCIQSFRPIEILPELFVHNNLVSNFSTLNQFINARLITILRLILFFKTSSPQFQTMNIDDKVALIKFNIPSLFWINMSLFYNPITNRFCEDEQDNLIFNGKNLLDFYGVDIYNKIIKYLCLLNQFSRIDSVIIYLLLLILFFSHFSSCTSLDEPILLDYNHIRQTQNFYILLLVQKSLKTVGERNTCLLISKLILTCLNIQNLSQSISSIESTQTSDEYVLPLMKVFLMR